jgi:hypothetical protein
MPVDHIDDRIHHSEGAPMAMPALAPTNTEIESLSGLATRPCSG